MSLSSPLLQLSGAVAGNGIDAPVAAHYGSFNSEQRTLVSGEGFVDLSHRDVFTVAGPDRLTWLHSLTTQHLQDLHPGVWTSALILSPTGHTEFAFSGVDDGETLTAHTEPGQAQPLLEYLDRMRFMMRVEVADVTADVAVCWRPSSANENEPDENDPGRYDFVPRAELTTYADAAEPACGLWAYEALRIARGEPRIGIDTDARTIPNEAGWIPAAVHLDKGCYRGQETVARVHTLGRPPRRLTMLHLDGSEHRLPDLGAEIKYDGRAVGFVGSSARHFELGPIALAMVKRSVPLDAVLETDGISAAQQVIVDPEVGLHVRPNVR